MAEDLSAAGSPNSSNETDIPLFGFQFVDAYLYDAAILRRDALDDELQRPNIDLSIHTEADDELPGFTALLTVNVQFRYQEQNVCEVNTVNAGVFRKVGEVSPDDAARFQTSDCAVLLWPYCRAAVGELIRLAGLSMPPLPTIDVRRTRDSRALDVGVEPVAEPSTNNADLS